MSIQLATLPPELALADPGPAVRRAHVVLIGAGGVGARLAPLLVKHLIAGDVLTIVDYDTVEPKNLLRQHFIASDVGKAKAEVVAERARKAAPVPGIRVDAYRMLIAGAEALDRLMPRYLAQGNSIAGWDVAPINGRDVLYTTIVISAIDSIAGRREIRKGFERLLPCPRVWIDCGNETFSGQALVAAFAAPLVVKVPGQLAQDNVTCSFDGWAELAPSYLDRHDDEDTTDPCAVRVDTQSVLANTWAATAAATLAAPFITSAPIVSLGISFSVRSGGSITVGAGRLDPPPQGRYSYHPWMIRALKPLLA